ncbi:Sua5 YciO YrdC YwlC family protein [Hydrogenimonas urashimensis]|uniref:Sua5 YciO YrdC YwlC family protein n=1 Tax=Hydrogenimonas urashimensis TaxID=2740515 RepID=UPI001915AE9A|nr:Sua5 YciO YrdC YwlC family protein [Hydrogenimonas urashimensis]
MMRRDFVYLVQTDTTVGFLSCSAHRLAAIKQRPPEKHFLKAINRFSDMAGIGRVPAAHRKFVRRARKRSFILPNGQSFRVVQGKHRDFIAKFGWCYSTSANLHGRPFDEAFAKSVCDVVVESKEGFSDKTPSQIWHLHRTGKVKIR